MQDLIVLFEDFPHCQVSYLIWYEGKGIQVVARRENVRIWEHLKGGGGGVGGDFPYYSP